MADDDLHKIPGPALILAGPGTGKTTRLGKRIRHLVHELNVSPNDITIITFTTAAAKNMRNRISDKSKPDLYLPFSSQPKSIRTMHSLGHKILRENSTALGLGDSIRVVPDDYLRSIIVGDAAQLAGLPRGAGDEVVKCRQFGNCKPHDDERCKICTLYKAILRRCSAVDHDEQILLACRFIKDNPEALAKYKASARHLLVDEYQDINAAQFELISLLSEGQRDGLFVVGDDDQSIYSWRGGSPEFIRRFNIDFGADAKVVPLLESFRCHRHILEGAMRIVEEFDRQRLHKVGFEYRVEDGPKIQIHNVPSDEKEANEVRRIIEKALPSQDVLILVPHRQFRAAIAEELRSAQIPFSSPVNLPGQGLPLISTLSLWLSNPADSLSFRRCLEAYLERPGTDVPSKLVKKREKKEQREIAFGRIAELWNDVLSGHTNSLWSSLDAKKNADDMYTPAWSAFANLLDLYRSGKDIAAFSAGVANHLAPWRKIPEFLTEVSSWVESVSERGSFGEVSGVRLMTLQGAKGLEASVVCVVGLEDGTLPRDFDEVSLTEQARLLFVSMTRAKNELHLFHARKRSGGVVLRNIYEKGEPPDIKRSRFINSIPSEHVETTFHPTIG